MKLILKSDVENLGAAGDIVSVKPGFARNYLLPQGLAYEATARNLARIEAEREKAEERARRDYLEARRRAAQLDGMALEFTARAGDEGRLFGSITTAEIAEAITAAGVDFEVDRRRIALDEPIKSVGDHTVSIRLHPEVEVQIAVHVGGGEG